MKLYRGTRKRAAGAQTVMVTTIEKQTNGSATQGAYDLPLAPSQKLYNHSPSGFSWGYVGSGPAQLALAILFDLTGDADLSIRLHQRFKEDHVATWGSTFIITEPEIRQWIENQKQKEVS